VSVDRRHETRRVTARNELSLAQLQRGRHFSHKCRSLACNHSQFSKCRNWQIENAGGFAVGVLLHLRSVHSAVFGYLFPVILRRMSMANSLAQLMPLP